MDRMYSSDPSSDALLYSAIVRVFLEKTQSMALACCLSAMLRKIITLLFVATIIGGIGGVGTRLPESNLCHISYLIGINGKVQIVLLPLPILTSAWQLRSYSLRRNIE